MNRDDKNFLALKQADAKLELALQRYQQPDVEADMRTEYLRYLRLRIRPAMDRLIREGNVRTLQELIGQIPPDESSLKMAMQVAGDSGQGECSPGCGITGERDGKQLHPAWNRAKRQRLLRFPECNRDWKNKNIRHFREMKTEIWRRTESHRKRMALRMILWKRKQWLWRSGSGRISETG